MHRKLRRLARIEMGLERYLQRRKEKENITRERVETAARDHAIMLATLVLYGRPKLAEPLEDAWERCLIKFPAARAVSKYQLGGASKVFASILNELPGNTETQKLQRILDTAPHWLLKFTCAFVTAKILGLECPDLSDAPPFGNKADKEIWWPYLPSGTLQAGGLKRVFSEKLLTDEEREQRRALVNEAINEVRANLIAEGELPGSPKAMLLSWIFSLKGRDRTLRYRAELLTGKIGIADEFAN